MLLRICAISDTHLYRPCIPDGDVLIHAGDICSLGIQSEFESEISWLSRQMHAQKFYIPGNHDKFIQNNYAFSGDFCKARNINLVVDEPFNLDNIRCYGSPWTPIFRNWAFMHTPEQAANHWSALPGNLDILITHGPPRGIFDSCPLPVGCRELYKAVKRTKPKIHIMGHIHEEHGRRLFDKNTLYANVCVLDGYYQPVQDPIFLIDAEKSGKEFRFSGGR